MKLTAAVCCTPYTEICCSRISLSYLSQLLVSISVAAAEVRDRSRKMLSNAFGFLISVEVGEISGTNSNNQGKGHRRKKDSLLTTLALSFA